MHRYVCAGGRCLECNLSSIEFVCKGAFRNAVHHYEKLIYGEIGKEEFQTAQNATNEKKASWDGIIASKAAYEEQYQMFRKLLRACYKEIALGEIMDCIDEILTDTGKQIMVRWCIK